MNKKISRPPLPKRTALSRNLKDNSFLTNLDNTVCLTNCQVQNSPTYSEDSEIKSKFKPKHEKSIYLSDIYLRLGKAKKSARVCDCVSYLEFAHEVDSYGTINEKGKLHKAYFCRDRFCPMCSWRRSLKLFSQVAQCIPKLTKDYKLLFLTLTIPNCREEEFTQTIDRLMSAWSKMTHLKKWKSVIKGFFRVLEVTRHKKKDNLYGTLHPHFHIILIVSKSYGTNKDFYISRNEFLEMWQQCFEDDSITQVDVRLLKNKDSKEITESKDVIGLKALESALAETCKYMMKDSDYLDDTLSPEEQEKLLSCLDNGLHHRRLAHFGGVFKDLYNKLGFEDVENENTDLTHIEDSINSGVALLITRWRWGFGCYEMFNKTIQYKKEVCLNDLSM